MVSLGGATEASIWSIIHPVAEAADPDWPSVPYGRPLLNQTFHVLDEALEPRPDWVPGELYIGGIGLAREYWRDAEKTAERFLHHPATGERLYRTGDLGRFRPGGDIEFLGREDLQVKVGGHRIELGEIEAHLGRHPGVREAVVTVAGDPRGERRLVAHVVAAEAAGDVGVGADELRSFLGDRLPAYMVPDVFLRRAALPLSANGKVDRGRLAAEAEAARRPRAGYLPPRDPVEEALAAVWAQVLGVERVGIDDDLFDLGAHSLLATQLLTRVNRAFGVGLALRTLFEQPTVARLAEEVRRALRAGRTVEAPPLVPVPRGGRLPLSFAQQRIWFFDRWQPGNAVFNLATAVDLLGDLRLPELGASFDAMLGRHETLRTRFRDLDGEPVQVIDPPGQRAAGRPAALPLVDLAALPGERRRAEAERLAAAAALAPFDLERGPLLRAFVIRRGRRDHLAVLTLHHIVADGWSMGLLIQEIAAVYEAALAGRPSPLPPLAVQFADYAVWQRRWLQGEALAAELAWWRERLAGAPASLALPFDRPRGAAQRFRGGRRPLRLPRAFAERLREIGRRGEATLFMVLLAAWKALLLRYAGQADLAVGTLVANRNQREVEPLVGCLVNALVLRTRLDEELPFAGLVERVREVALGAYAHQDLPFEKLVEDLNPDRQLSATPLFQVLVVFQTLAAPVRELPGLRLAAREVERGTVNYDLFFFLDDTDDGVDGRLDFDVDLFDAATAARLAAHFEALLHAVAHDPQTRLADVPLLSEAERHHLLVEWNDARRPSVAESATVLDLVASQAESRPDAVAAVLGGESVTYGELWRRAEAGARRLAGHGVGRGDVVALLAGRGPAFITAALAVWRRGAAYLPLDPQHPGRRTAGILSQAGAALLLADHAHAGQAREAGSAGFQPAASQAFKKSRQDAGAPSGASTGAAPFAVLEEILELAPTRAETSSAPTSNNASSNATSNATSKATTSPGCAAAAAPDDLAYVIFTSGSTGLPKGAMVEHRGMLNHLEAKIGELGLSAADGVAQNASQCFDVSVWQMLAALAVGGTVHVLPDDVAHDPWLLLDELESSGLTVLEVVPSLLRVLLDEAERRGARRPGLAALRWLIPTGEALPGDLCRRWLALYPEIPLLNAYGPTECSDDVSHQRIARIAREDAAGVLGSALAPPTSTASPDPIVPRAPIAATVPIGRPVANLRLHVVDRQLRPVPPGVAGELCVAGIGVGRGYLHDAARTAAVFVPDPFAEAATGLGGRLYRTGDLARWRPAGHLEFLGRLDHQVKVRGFRIELGEIEAVLREHEAVAAAVVVARQDGPAGDARPEISPEIRLVAYIERSAAAAAAEDRDAGLLGEQVAEWGAVFDDFYAAEGEVADATFNTAAWESSYTGGRIPEAEMREWLADTVDRLRSLAPRRVLELGCGTGMLLFRLAPDCERYVGTDVAAEALEYLRRRLPLLGAAADRVELRQGGAADLAGFASGSFDAVVLNSVVQYFPSVEYLVEVLEQAVRLLAPGGAVFLGDLRSLPLLDAFHVSVELARAAPTVTREQLARRVRARRSDERELVLDPALFEALAAHLRGEGIEVGVEIHPKRGHSHNELTRFRYQVVLRVGEAEPAAAGAAPAAPQKSAAPDTTWINWQEEGLTLTDLPRLLAAAETAPTASGTEARPVCLWAVPNARVAEAVAAARWLAEGEPGDTVADLRAALAGSAGFQPATSQAFEKSRQDAGAPSNDGAPACADLEFGDARAGSAGFQPATSQAFKKSRQDAGAPSKAACAETVGATPRGCPVGGPAGRAVDPQKLWDLAEASGWDVELGWSRPAADGAFEAVLRRRVPGAADARPLRLPPPPSPSSAAPMPSSAISAAGHWSRYANHPLGARAAREVVPRLRAFLAERLPEPMIPAAFVLLEALPLTANGKVDHRALPAPEAEALSTADRADRAEPVAPRTLVEESLAAVWREVLGGGRFGVDDNFFDAGGHSLLATQVMSRVRATFGVELPLRDLFEAPTVAGLASRIEAALATPADTAARAALEPIPRVSRREPPLCSFAQERLWFIDQLEPGNPAYNLPAALRAAGDLDVAVLERCLSEVLRRHEALRTVFPVIHGRPRQAVPSGRRLAAAAPRPRRPAGRRARAAKPSASPAPTPSRPFDLAAGPLFRAALLHLAPGAPAEHVLLLNIHHIVSDGWSIGVLIREVGALYRAFAAGRPSPLPDLPVQYADFAAWQRDWLAGGRRAPRRPARLVARSPRRGAAGRSSCPAAGRAARRALRAAPPAGCATRPRSPRPSRRLGQRAGRHSVHDPARRLPGPALPRRAAGGRGGRHAGRQPRAPRARGADRLLRQHPGGARRPLGRPHVRRAPAAGARGRPRRLRPPGPAVREAGRRAQPRTRPQPGAAVPGHAGVPEHLLGPRRAARRLPRPDGGRRRHRPASS